jgi:hypothetical protein
LTDGRRVIPAENEREAATFGGSSGEIKVRRAEEDRSVIESDLLRAIRKTGERKAMVWKEEEKEKHAMSKEF